MPRVATSRDTRPLDAAVDFPLHERQRHIRQMAETKRQMQRVADQINKSLASYASRLSYR